MAPSAISAVIIVASRIFEETIALLAMSVDPTEPSAIFALVTAELAMAGSG